MSKQPDEKTEVPVASVEKMKSPEEQQQERLQEIYQWSTYLTAEQTYDEFLWTPQTLKLLHRLYLTRGNMIAVVGLQGIGKTALRTNLYWKLRELCPKAEEDDTINMLWWEGKKTLQQLKEPDENEYLLNLWYACKKIDSSEILHIAQTVGMSPKHIESWINPLSLTTEEKKLFNQIDECHEVDTLKRVIKKRRLLKKLKDAKIIERMEKVLGKRHVNEIRDACSTEKFIRTHTLLVDTADFSRSKTSEVDKQIKEIQNLWQFILQPQLEYEPDEKLNFVVFFQKELWDKHKHFFFGKMRTFILKPLTIQQLMFYYINKFSEVYPFTEAALKELAVLSRGIFRRFKKYVGICLDNLFNVTMTPILKTDLLFLSKDKNNINNIYKDNSKRVEDIFSKNTAIVTLKDIRKWITPEQLEKDMSLELYTVFPRNKEHRQKTVQLLRHLTEGPLSQRKVAEAFFHNNQKQCSRFLQALERWGYITRCYEGKTKSVELKEVNVSD